MASVNPVGTINAHEKEEKRGRALDKRRHCTSNIKELFRTATIHFAFSRSARFKWNDRIKWGNFGRDSQDDRTNQRANSYFVFCILNSLTSFFVSSISHFGERAPVVCVCVRLESTSSNKKKEKRVLRLNKHDVDTSSLTVPIRIGTKEDERARKK